MKIYAYENSCGDKGFITADSYDKAVMIYKEKYPNRNIVYIDTDDYCEDGACIFKASNFVENNKLYNLFPWLEE